MNKIALICSFLLLVFSHIGMAQEKEPEPFQFIQIGEIRVFGKPVDQQTRCTHWHSQLDIIAIKFKCCGKYYPCFSCHEEEADHSHQVWPKNEFSEKAILCGVCGTELSIKNYMASDNTCPHCQASFNPGCSNHYHLYFETKKKGKERQRNRERNRFKPLASQGMDFYFPKVLDAISIAQNYFPFSQSF